MLEHCRDGGANCLLTTPVSWCTTKILRKHETLPHSNAACHQLTLLTGWKKFMHAPQASALPWNRPGFLKKWVGYFSNSPYIYIYIPRYILWHSKTAVVKIKPVGSVAAWSLVHLVYAIGLRGWQNDKLLVLITYIAFSALFWKHVLLSSPSKTLEPNTQLAMMSYLYIKYDETL